MAAEELRYIYAGDVGRSEGVVVDGQTDAFIFRGSCFLGSGGWAFKQHVVPCVNPIL